MGAEGHLVVLVIIVIILMLIIVYIYICIYIYIYIYIHREREREIESYIYLLQLYVSTLCVEFSTCACRPCAGGMPILSVSFRVERMIREGNPAATLRFMCCCVLYVVARSLRATAANKRALF